MSNIPDPLWLFHITHISNLPNILRQGGLVANNAISGQYTNIAHQEIQTRRHSKQIPCGIGGVLHDYVPFYFCRLSPMLYAISKNRVEGYSGGQAEVLYLAVKFSDIQQAGLPWVFTDGHAAMDFSEFYTDPTHFDQVDWKLMQAQYWSDTDDDPDRKRRRQAEFLVHQCVPWACITGIGVYDAAQQSRVASILDNAPSIHKPTVKVLRKWYY
jgi:hypothetical protein